MRQRRRMVWLGLTAVACSATGGAGGGAGQVIPAGPVLGWAALGVDARVAVRPFPVHGRTLAALRMELSRMGPEAGNGVRGHALTAYRIEVDWIPERAPDGCRVGELKVRAIVDILLPRWEESRDASEAEFTAWMNALESLREHESRHRDLTLEAALALRRRLQPASTPTCRRLARRVTAWIHEGEDALAAARRRLDDAEGR